MTEAARRRRERIIALFIMGFLAFNYPLLSLFAVEVQIFGIPLLVVYLFVAWGIFIFLTWWLVGRPDPSSRRPGKR